ncbi:ATPase [Nocardiopsis sp. ARC36]
MPHTDTAPQIRVISFGYGHAPAPDAHLTLDLRTHFRDPHVSADMRYRTAHDQVVRDHVLNTPGIRSAISGMVTAALALTTGPSGNAPITLAAGCTGGRHRAPTTAMVITDMLTALGISVELEHRDLDREVINR